MSLPKGVARQLKHLNAITTGPGAIFFSGINRLDLHMRSDAPASTKGAREFRREMLPPIQFYNPTMVISVQKIKDPAAVPRLAVEFTDGSSKTLNVADLSQAEILEKLVLTGKGTPVPESEVVRLGEVD